MNDPHQLHSGGGTGSPANQLTTNPQQAFYSPQMLLQQQYMQMPSLYGSQQAGGIMLQPHQVDMQAFQQQQQLLQVMQQQQQQQALQTQQRTLAQHDTQESMKTSCESVALQQQQHYQRALQQAAQQQQQQRQLEQQRLLEQQQRQLDRMHQEREAARLQQQQQQEEMLRQKAQEAARQQQEEMQRRLAYQKEQQLKLQREAHERMLLEQQRLKEEQRKQEEAQRLAEEARKREEEERRELEKVMAVREEQKRKQKEALEAHTAMREKADSIPINIHLGGCHALTKLVSHLPFPNPFLPHSNCLRVNVHPDMDAQLAQTDTNIAQYLADAISLIDITDVSLKHTEGESNDLDTNNEPFLVKNILAFNPQAFDVEPPIASTSDEGIPMEILSSELKEETTAHPEEQPTTDGLAVEAESAYTQPSTSVQEEAGKEENCSPNEAPKENTAPAETTPVPPKPKTIQDQDQTQLRKQIVSLGKQPKAQQGRKKKDMVESLYDSLTGYFDPTEGRRRRQRTKTFEEEQHEKKQLELIAQMELAEASDRKIDEDFILILLIINIALDIIIITVSDKQLELIAQMELAEASDRKIDEGQKEVEHRPGHAGPSGEETGEEEQKPKFFENNKRGRKRQRESITEQPDRPPTPTEIIQQRENEWRERQRKRQEKHKRRQNDSESDCWNNEVMAEKESYAKFTSIIDQIFDNVEDMDIVGGAEDEEAEIPQELLIDKHQLEELRREAQKLKSWKRINKVYKFMLIVEE
ncbi:Nipped-B-like protein pqn-85 [Toxocara canis]|uniref:Nipped-B-like protein pqn-85 n=1 Tax=Toxocara canis TaxID=6265 RepID=A0A0B2VAY8_TOXCA|nr:Nipped-B-like protein pqn-85 [Toxocara canis]